MTQQNSNLYIQMSQSSKDHLIKNFGPEVILRCLCGDTPSHSMFGQYRVPACPQCRQKCELIFHEWGVVTNG